MARRNKDDDYIEKHNHLEGVASSLDKLFVTPNYDYFKKKNAKIDCFTLNEFEILISKQFSVEAALMITGIELEHMRDFLKFHPEWLKRKYVLQNIIYDISSATISNDIILGGNPDRAYSILKDRDARIANPDRVTVPDVLDAASSATTVQDKKTGELKEALHELDLDGYTMPGAGAEEEIPEEPTEV